MNSKAVSVDETDFDVVVVGAGIGGLYGVHRFVSEGLSVLGLEGAEGVGGVWSHNRYPGARVDIESFEYSYHFSSELYKEWTWTERYASQPELLRYLNHVADRFDLRRHYKFSTWLEGAQWNPEGSYYDIETSGGQRYTSRFLVMASGNLSKARDPQFPGLDDFAGEKLQASHWPDREVQLAGKRVGIIGTGSSGVQMVPIVAEAASHLSVFQRSPNYSAPAQNGPMDAEFYNKIAEDVPGARKYLLTTPGARHVLAGVKRAEEFTEEERQQVMEEAWAIGGYKMARVFADQGSNQFSNDCVAEFVRNKIRATVNDPEIAELLCPKDHPLGSRRICVDTNYYQTYNRDNVTLVDVSKFGIERFDETGLFTEDGKHHELDVVIFALGFQAFTGSIDAANIRNAEGAGPTDHWKRGPRTLLGLMTAGFPNFFFSTGPGSPSVIANLFVHNEQCLDWIADTIKYVVDNGYAWIVATAAAEERWGEVVADAAGSLLRLRVKNYMVHVNDDGSRVFIPYAGGVGAFAKHLEAAAVSGYEEFTLVQADVSASLLDDVVA